ncbi:hypothetical protein N7532_002292 [Penicillium argentinense]|uniref:ML-like domain-containing protein n=1 Tax=Penicillium argentinense TaxID=1131581 RepID=A0A9W9G081_9EURO|nr:uncharacterized protein N7532_002292 [Penicillium argentinense]KAJ5109647.1 hypothetical protein N7532_002292 [Penicillium argentinense]
MPETDMCHDSTRRRDGEDDVEHAAADATDATRSLRRRALVMPLGQTARQRRFRLQPGPGAGVASGVWWMALLCLVMTWISPAAAALLDFDNCLDKSILESYPLQLQFVPLDVGVTFDLSDPLHPLNVTVYGNVSGTADGSSYNYDPNDPQWTNSSSTYGKIVDLSKSNNKYSTLLTAFDVLSYTPWSNPSRFCSSLTQGDCPLGPVFNGNVSDLRTLHSFSVEHDMVSTYRFSTITPTFTIRSGDSSAAELGCISVPITPDFGAPLKNALAYIPLVILVLVGLTTILAAMYSPWGTTDVFRWTSNYGRDEDVLRLVTPGFADCLQYLQYVVLTGALSLDYPGFFQPAVSHGSWSVLMFNQSFVNPGGNNPIQDGVYAVNGTYGLDRMNQLVGMTSKQDIWPGMMVWLLVILGCVTLVIQLGFALRWLHRELANTSEQDLRAKNMPFTVGNVIRIVFNFLLLPIISLSFFQLVTASGSPAYSVALAAIVVVVLLCFSIWMVRVIISTRPKSHLFDDLPTVLLYGPLYNTYCDDAAAFATVPIFLNFARGIAIGALQPSGIAQVVLLAICEVVSVLTLVAFRPFPSPTHMNLYHCLFSFVRFLTIILSVVFVPSLTISRAARGWIGYLILVLHALVLIFGFFLNALQTLIEVLARLAGAGGATRGGLSKVFGMRQLSRREARGGIARQSMGSEAAMLANVDGRMSSQWEGSRPRSLSGSSGMLLNRATASEGRASAILDYASSQGGGSHSRAPSGNLYANSPTAYTGAGGSPSSSTFMAAHPRDPYYRPPRPGAVRRDTQPGANDRSKRSSRTFLKPSRSGGADDDLGDGPPMSGRGTPVPAYLPAPKDDMELEDPRQRKDYAVREVDFYYRVRGPPLSHTGTRKLKTGPADPTGPVSSATGWFRNFFQGKTKDKGKGFEVVRSARAPPPASSLSKTITRNHTKTTPSIPRPAATHATSLAATKHRTETRKVTTRPLKLEATLVPLFCRRSTQSAASNCQAVLDPAEPKHYPRKAATARMTCQLSQKPTLRHEALPTLNTSAQIHPAQPVFHSAAAALHLANAATPSHRPPTPWPPATKPPARVLDETDLPAWATWHNTAQGTTYTKQVPTSLLSAEAKRN